MKCILITGGTGKIGRVLVNHFIREDWFVIVTTRDLDNLTQLKNDLNFDDHMRSRLKGIAVDFKSSEYIWRIKEFFIIHPKLWPRVVVNNARSIDSLKVEESGFSSRSMLIAEYMIDVVASYEISVLFSEKNDITKSIINISSIYGIVPFNPNLYDNYEQSAPIQYSLAKAAVIHLTKELSIRFRNKGIRVNTVSYGGVEGRVNEDFQRKYSILCPEGKMLSVEQTIGPVDFLASDKSLGMTGQNIIMDGGWTTW